MKAVVGMREDEQTPTMRLMWYSNSDPPPRLCLIYTSINPIMNLKCGLY